MTQSVVRVCTTTQRAKAWTTTDGALRMSGQSSKSSRIYGKKCTRVLCSHQLPTVILKVSKPNENFGKQFYRCSKWQGIDDCRFLDGMRMMIYLQLLYRLWIMRMKT